MGTIISWTDQLAVGNDAIDDDHKHLFTLANAIHAGLLQPGYDDSIRAVLDELMTYAAAHFDREEALMTLSRFPHQAEHMVEHRLLRYHLRNLHNRYVGGDHDLADDVQLFIDRWLAQHIMTADMRLVHHMRAQSGQLAA